MGKEITKTCINCGNKFKTLNKEKKFCNRHCYMLHRWKDSEYANKLKEVLIPIFASSGYKEKIHNSSVEMWQKPGFKEDMSNLHKERLSSKEAREKLAEIAKIVQNRPGQREKNSDYQKQYNKIHPEKGNMHSITMKEKWNDIEFKEKMINLACEKWKDPEYAVKIFKKHGNYKDYVFPSGKTVRVQGYEPDVLDLLLQSFEEDDLVVGLKNIINEIGQIHYTFNNATRTYYPDIYIKSQNLVIEVKSQWTYNMEKEKNEAKRLACLEKGLNFEFIIL